LHAKGQVIPQIFIAKTKSRPKGRRTIMLSAKTLACVLCALATCARAQQLTSSQLPTQSKRIVIATSIVLDGKGGVLHNTRLVVEDSKIVAIDPNVGPVDYDLRGLTLLPGWIDSHVHIAWSFGKDGKNGGPAGKDRELVHNSSPFYCS
jgi:hypothetical protein